jgi:hypothetical protein
VERPAAERAVRWSEGVSADTKVSEVVPLTLMESNLTIEEVAERLGTSVEAACSLVVAN